MRIVNNINSDWLFKKGEHITTEIDESWQTLELPHTWNAFDGQDGGGDYYKGKGTYTTVLERPSCPEGYRIYLEFEGVNSVAEVYIDGEKKAEHKGGYSTFRVEITEAFKDKLDADITVVADNTIRTDIYPQSADFTFYGGIYRDVNVICVPETHIDLEYYGGPGIMYESSVEGEDACIKAKAFIKNPEERDRVRFSLYDEEGDLVTETYELAKETTESELFVEEANLWRGVFDPYLYTLEVQVVRNNEVLDEKDCQVGIRSFFVDPEKGFFLNGISMPLRGVSRHQDKLGLGNALTEEDHYEDAEIISELGANTVRLAHYQHNQAFYNACDEYGFVVWAEIPFISIMSADEKGHENCREQMKELIIQNYNHPSICFWGISNEITIGGDKPGLYENLVDLNNLVKELDKTRLTTMAQVSMLPMDNRQNQITDTLSYNHYFGWYGKSLEDNEKWFDEFHKKYPDRPFGISEYGCEGIVSWHSDEPKVKDYTEEYQALYHEHLAKVIDERPYLWATHVWNMFDFGCDARDEGGVKGRNNKGLVTMDRKIYKDAFYLYKAYWTEDPFVHVTGRRYFERPYEKMDVKVYSNAKEVTLLVDGKEFASLEADKVFIFKDVPLKEKGNTRITALCDDGTPDEVSFKRVSKPSEAYTMPKGEDEDLLDGVKNWFDDIKADSVAPEFTFNPEYFSINDVAKDIVANDDGYRILAGFIEKQTGMKVKRSMFGIMGGLTLKEQMALTGAGEAMNDPKALDALKFLNAELQKIKKN